MRGRHNTPSKPEADARRQPSQTCVLLRCRVTKNAAPRHQRFLENLLLVGWASPKRHGSGMALLLGGRLRKLGQRGVSVQVVERQH